MAADSVLAHSSVVPNGSQDGAFGVYVHVPFCARRCDYCAFATWTDRHHLMEPYLAACRRSVLQVALPPATSVFFGGGTPSLVPARALLSVLSAVDRRPGAEVTVECNPETVTPRLLAAYRQGGVNRLSFGVQSMRPHVLASLGRQHDGQAVRRAIAWADEAGFAAAWNVDVIYGAAGESLDDWARTLDEVVELAPAHVSAYALTVEAGTPLAADPRRHPDDDDQADKYQLADRVLADAGLQWYELSNWSRPGHECRHNQLYWAQDDYHGIGSAAHSHVQGRRWWNVRTPDRYVALVESGESPVAGAEQLSRPQRALERLQLSLRTPTGVPAASLPTAGELVDDGLVTVGGGRAVLTLRGRLLANEVAHRLVVPAGARLRGSSVSGARPG
jgi:oxygen-independent coproporphyrinogen-3 oxidase